MRKLQFPTGGDRSLSLSWYDVVTGYGYKTLYGAKRMEDATTYTYWLMDGTAQTYNSYFTTGNHSTAVDIYYDSVFTAPANVGGSFFFEIPIQWYSNDAAPTTQNIVITARHVTAGGTETTLGTITKTIAITKSDPNYVYEMIAGKFTLANRHFKRGEKIRLTVATAIQSATTGIMRFYHEPKNYHADTTLTYPMYSTQLVVNIPFRVNP